MRVETGAAIVRAATLEGVRSAAERAPSSTSRRAPIAENPWLRVESPYGVELPEQEGRRVHLPATSGQELRLQHRVDYRSWLEFSAMGGQLGDPEELFLHTGVLEPPQFARRTFQLAFQTGADFHHVGTERFDLLAVNEHRLDWLARLTIASREYVGGAPSEFVQHAEAIGLLSGEEGQALTRALAGWARRLRPTRTSYRSATVGGRTLRIWGLETGATSIGLEMPLASGVPRRFQWHGASTEVSFTEEGLVLR
jgi:hypothetical protein